MNFHSFKVENDYFKCYSNAKWFRNSSSKKIVKKLNEDELSVFHSHFVSKNLLHIVLIFPKVINDSFQSFLNCVYDIDKNIFLIEENEELLHLLEETSFFRQLTPTMGTMPSEEIVKIIEKKTIS